MSHSEWPSRKTARGLVAALTVVAAFLFGWGLERNSTHPYYTAAVRSMSRNWHDFLFGAFDPSGFITTDKLPGAFWVQALSVRMFGFHNWSVLLPQALAATACVPLLYTTVRRWMGIRAGLIAACAYALTPITVALARTNIPDALMVFFLVLGAHAFWRWTEPAARRRGLWLAASAFWLGFAFNVKMGQALLAVPVFCGVCFLLARGTWWRRLTTAGLYGAGIAAVSLVWMVFVTLTPADRRPYIDGSLHNSVWEMVFQYNGFGRLGGQATGDNPLAGGAVLVGAGGPPGLGRLFGAQTAGQISWLIPAALLGLGIGVAVIGRRWRAARTAGTAGPAESSRLPGTSGLASSTQRAGTARLAESSRLAGTRGSADSQLAETPSVATSARLELAGWLFWGGWLAVYAAAFITASGIHSYYTSSLAPAIAALAGAGLARALQGARWQLPVMVLATGGWAFAASHETPHYQPWLRWTVVLAAVAAAVLLLWSRMVPALQKTTALVAATALFAAPAVWASSVLFQKPSAMGSVAAAAGPPQNMFGGGRHGRQRSAVPAMFGGLTSDELVEGLKRLGRGADPAVSRFLASHQGSDRFAAAVEGSMAAASYLARNLPVLPMGGFTGDAPAPTPAGLAAMVDRGIVRYAVVGGNRHSDAKPDARTQWVTANCRAVPGLGTGDLMATTVYDCASGSGGTAGVASPPAAAAGRPAPLSATGHGM